LPFASMFAEVVQVRSCTLPSHVRYAWVTSICTPMLMFIGLPSVP
jgi:hypothetical protein